MDEKNKNDESKQESGRNDDTLRNIVDKQVNPEIISNIDLENNPKPRDKVTIASTNSSHGQVFLPEIASNELSINKNELKAFDSVEI